MEVKCKWYPQLKQHPYIVIDLEPIVHRKGQFISFQLIFNIIVGLFNSS